MSKLAQAIESSRALNPNVNSQPKILGFKPYCHDIKKIKFTIQGVFKWTFKPFIFYDRINDVHLDIESSNILYKQAWHYR